MKQNRIEVYLSFAAVVLAAIFLRLIPHIPNVAPIAALALFSGIKVPNGKGFALPLIAMVVSDYFLGFHATLPFVYVSFLFIAGIGYLLRNKKTTSKIFIGSISGSLLFYVITNFGVWATSSMYEKSISGLMNCYYMGLPFFRNTVIGDLLYVGVFFLGFRLFSLLFVLMLPSRLSRERYIGNTV